MRTHAAFQPASLPRQQESAVPVEYVVTGQDIENDALPGTTTQQQQQHQHRRGRGFGLWINRRRFQKRYGCVIIPCERFCSPVGRTIFPAMSPCVSAARTTKQLRLVWPLPGPY